MSKAGRLAKARKEAKVNKYRIENYGACPYCGKGFTSFGIDASHCPDHGWIKDKNFISHKHSL